ncbi:basic secretory family protein [Aspergillus luchuensis]|uniref:Uncharacterized protein n=1 Tax=Aspergillus kawachii TaxID=1069201 RepID=A0A7R7W6E9_ASPKA|nr:uncharacterized protein AKAW2_30518A [Aspergillus luchuensis]BCR97199.1 hypothetical protein AKAW2_30518A [Aspergillus luchuensis]BCS09666.1 hypothetical protein ALUC_30483A [Aspergillus luchuensis]GAA88507.1 PBSP domain protein [Aspergillus luchuensis IFO 4308]
MSTSTPQATPSLSPLPPQQPPPPSSSPNSNSNSNPPRPQDQPTIPQPTLRLQINDLRHPASKTFLTLLPDLTSTLTTALTTIIEHLYTPPQQEQPTFHPTPPPTRSITLLLHTISGVAYTTGTELDNDHKEIHLSLSYIETITTNGNNSNPTAELTGVLTHELVHCYQHTAPPDSPPNTPHPPGGLIEGIADFVRLKAGLEPPHWKRPASAKERADKWDEGYQHTAYFLAWLEDVKVGKGAVGMMNDRLLRVGYADGFWEGLFGLGVLELWEEYGVWLDGGGGTGTTTSGGGCWEDEIVDRV